MALTTNDFDYDLNSSLIAQQPLEQRDLSRLMVLRRSEGSLSHHVFADLPELLAPGDLLVANDTQVIPAKFSARRKTGGRLEGLFVRELALGRWEVMLKGAGRCRAGETLFPDLPSFPEGGQAAVVKLLENLGQGQWIVDVQPARQAVELLELFGSTPLPPYIRRAGQSGDSADRQRYQTVYAQKPGAVAAPTAGLHFTGALMERLARRGVQTARVTLHVGLGTFTPVKVEDISRHAMHSEWYELSPQAAGAINAARRDGRRIIAVGTTSVRVLETAASLARPADRRQPIEPSSGWTNIFIRPPADFLVSDGLVTNFHLPRSTLLMLVAAFCSPGEVDGIRTILAAYEQAVGLRYRFYSYGDAMLIL